MAVTLSRFAETQKAETAFTVLAAAKRLQAEGREIVELEIGDSPFPSADVVKQAAISAIQANQTHYGPSAGLPELRETAAHFLRREFRIDVAPDGIVVAPGAKPFEQYFCETFLNPGDGALVFSPHFPTYPANIERRGARSVFASLTHERQFRPDPRDVEKFLADDPAPKAIFLNSPHNPTGGVALKEDLAAIAELVRGKEIAIFSDEPYCHMVWRGEHHSILAEPGMLEQTVAAYTMSKSYSMSGWRLGFAACHPEVADRISIMINTSVSCVPPFVQQAGIAALEHAGPDRDEAMQQFHAKVRRLCDGLSQIDGFEVLPPTATFYAFPRVASICQNFGISSHGLAMYLLEGADDSFGVACLGGECFGEAGAGFLRFSCAETDDRIDLALAFIAKATALPDQIEDYLKKRPQYRLPTT